MSVDDIERFLTDGKRYLAKNVNFSILGGEPLLDKNRTIGIAQLAQKWGGEAVVSTNGTLIDEQFAKDVRDNDLIVQVSLEGSTPDLNDKIRGKGSFNKAKKGIEILVDNDVYTILSMVVQELNFDDMERFYLFAKDIGSDEVRFIPLNIMGRARSSKLKPVTNLQLVRAIFDLLKKYPESKDRLRRDYFTILKTICAMSNKRTYCGTGLKTILIDADGQTYPCPNHQYHEFRCGNIRSKSFKEIWLKSPVLQKVRATYNIEENNENCPNCPVKHWCMGGCRGETYENIHQMKGKSVRCDTIKEAIIEMLWILGKEGEMVANSVRHEYF
jgi:radical SAM protein with 4Fe4S-binding SPASM domain